MSTCALFGLFQVIILLTFHSNTVFSKVVLVTWEMPNAAAAAWSELSSGSGGAVDAVVEGCAACEEKMCGVGVGYGDKPDEKGRVSLDAMIMDGTTMDAGAVGNLRFIQHAIRVAHAVMKYTKQTFLTGQGATDFALQMGFPSFNLDTNSSLEDFNDWTSINCQPNFWETDQCLTPDPSSNCGPYSIGTCSSSRRSAQQPQPTEIDHDTVGMVILDSENRLAAGTSTNGLRHKISGRVGDSPIVGSGSYADGEVGGAAATGNGDIMLRFVPSFYAVELMRNGHSPEDAASRAISRIVKFYPDFTGAVIALSINGDYGVSCHNMNYFPYTVMSDDLETPMTFNVPCNSNNEAPPLRFSELLLVICVAPIRLLLNDISKY